MANILRFVESNLTTVRLTLDYLEDGTSIPLPSNTKVWSGNITADGSNYITGKYENIPITLALHVHAATKAALDTALRAIVTEITRKNILEFQPDGGSSIFYDTFPYDEAQAQQMVGFYRDAFMVHPLTITLMAKPFARGAEESITVINNQVLNWSFEDHAVDDFTSWTETEVAGGGVSTVASITADYVYGSHACHLEITNAAGTATVETTDFITVNNDYHYFFSFMARRKSGADSLDAVIIQYTAGDVDLVDNILFEPTGADVWNYYRMPIHPHGEGGLDFHANCAKIKIRFEVNTAVAKWYIDGIIFSVSRYSTAAYWITNPLGIALPAADVLGDVPAPCDIYIDKFDDVTTWTNGILIGGRKNYDLWMQSYVEAATGALGYSVMSNTGVHREYTVVGELVLDGSLEEIAGTPGSNAETWDHWTASREVTYGYVIADNANHVYGDYGVTTWVANETTTGANYIETTAYIAVNPANEYKISLWYKFAQYTGFGSATVTVRCYTAGPAYISDITLPTIRTTTPLWTQQTLTIAPADWPGGPTAQIKIRISFTGRLVSWVSGFPRGLGDMLWIDGVSFYQSTNFLILDGSVLLDEIKGFVKPIIHCKLATALSGISCDLQGKITDGANDITDYALLASADNNLAIPAVWKYLELDTIELPNARLSDWATTTALYEHLYGSFGNFPAAANTLYVDDVTLLSTDNGLAYVASENYQHLIFDSQSDMPGVLRSYDGTLNKSAWTPVGSVEEPLTVDPQNGSNFVILGKYMDALANEYGQTLWNITLRYRPRYLLVK